MPALDRSSYLDSAFRKLAVLLGDLTRADENPSRFVRDLHTYWKAAGGVTAGKPRHADQYLYGKLAATGNPVRSLAPKLQGKMSLTAADAAALVHFCLSNWPETKLADEEGVTYKRLLSGEEICEISAFIGDRINNPECYSRADNDFEERHLPGDDSLALLMRYRAECDFHITIRPECASDLSVSGVELIELWSAQKEYWRLKERDGAPRVQAWILDSGDRRFEEMSSKLKYANVQHHKSKFMDIKLSKDNDTLKLWERLSARTVIAILDPYSDINIAQQMPQNRPDFLPHHLLFSGTPSDLLTSESFITLYGSSIDVISQRLFSVFCRVSTWNDTGRELKYFGHAVFRPEGGGEKGRALELRALSCRHDNAFRTVCLAAAQVLNLPCPVFDEFYISGEEAVRQLNFLGYEILTIDEFILKY